MARQGDRSRSAWVEGSVSSSVDADGGRFVGQVAIVTGGGSGLGQATAIRLASEGANVAVLDVQLDAAEATVLRITESGGRAQSRQVDVSEQPSVHRVVADVANSLGRPQVLINCAGVCQFDLTEEVALETWNRTIGVNLTGTFLMCQATLPYLLDGGGAIVNIASNCGLQGVPYFAAYAASQRWRCLAHSIPGVGILGARCARQCRGTWGDQHPHVAECRLPTGRRSDPDAPGLSPGPCAS